jgi:hypothetical protein
LSLLIEKSIDIKSTVLNIDEKASNQFSGKGTRKTKSNTAELIQELEL